MLLQDKLHHEDKVQEVISGFAREGREDQLVIFSGGERKMISRRILTLFSPVIRSLVSSLPCSTEPSIILPDFSLSTISHLANIITTGFTTGVKTESFREIYEVIDLAKHIGMDISDVRRDTKNLEMLDKIEDKPNEEETLEEKNDKDDTSEPVVEETSTTMKTDKISLLQEKQKKISKDILSFISCFRRGAKELECSECLHLLTRNTVVNHSKHHIIELDDQIAQLSTANDDLAEENSDDMVRKEADIDNSEKSIDNTVMADSNIKSIQPPNIKDVQVNVEKIKVEDNWNEKKKRGSNSKAINCQICDYRITLTQHLEKHYGIKHFRQELRSTWAEVSKNLICDICEYSVKKKADMICHVGSKHGYINKILIRKGYIAIKKKKSLKKIQQQMTEKINLLDEEPNILENILGILSQNKDSPDSEI